MRLSLCTAQTVLTLLLVHCGATVAITSVSILHECEYQNNCEAHSGAQSWCQSSILRKRKEDNKQLVLNISNANDNDNGVYQCRDCSSCCSTGRGDILSMLNVTVYGHATVSPPADEGCGRNACNVSYHTTQPYLEISNRIGYYPMKAVNKQGITMGRWMVMDNGQSKNIYTCKNFTCDESSVRSQFSIGTLAFMGEFGDAVNITDLENLNSTLQLVYRIEAVPITSGTSCRYSAERAVTYRFEVTSTSPSLSPSPSPSATHSPSPSAVPSPPIIGPLATSNPVGVMDIGTIAGIAASIVVAILIVVFVAVTLMVCYSKCQPQHTSYPELKMSSTFDDNLACSPTHAPENDTTLVAANGAIKCHKSLDSGHEDSEDTTSSGGEGDFILSVQPEDQMDTPAKPTEGDSISEESISLENFGEEQEVAL